MFATLLSLVWKNWRKATLSITLALCATMPVWALDLNQQVPFDIPPQKLATALLEFSHQAKVQVAVGPELGDRQSGGLAGTFTVGDALSRLLADSGLKYRVINDTSISIIAAVATDPDLVAQAGTTTDVGAAVPSDQAGRSDSQPTNKRNQATQLQGVEVTGTRIRGVKPVGSPLTIYSHDDIEKSGTATVDQFARQMPENFSGADSVSNFSSTGTAGRFSQGANDNAFGGSAFDLHGLGTTSTLTLLNGHRLAPAGANGLLVDSSMIPLSAVDRIEVLSDGASAIYGADAVAGVVNIVTRKDFDGAQTSVRYGGATGGGDDEVSTSQLLGKSWASGDALLSYEFDRQGGLDASQRDYIGNQGGPYSLIPSNRRNSAFFTGSQDLGDGTLLTGDAIYSDRNFGSQTTTDSDLYLASASFSGHARQSGISLGLQRNLFSDWQGDVNGNYSRVTQLSNAVTAIPAFSFQSLSVLTTNNSILEGNALANGSLAHWSGGAIKAAIGGGYRAESFDQTNSNTSSGVTSDFSPPHLQRQASNAFGELLVPFIGTTNAQIWARSLELSVAARYDHYSDFGSTTNPKVGILWVPISGLNVRSSYGTSFRAPALGQIGEIVYSNTNDYPDSASPSGVTDTLYISGGNPALRPEKARSFTAGFDVKPKLVQNLTFAATYFQTTFNDRIAAPLTLGNLNFSDPVLAPFITRNPSPSVVQGYFNSPTFQGDFDGGGPSSVTAIFNDQIANIASTRQTGIDFSTTYFVPIQSGRVNFSFAGTHLLQNTFEVLAGGPSFSLLNVFASPTSWKLHGSAGFSAGPFSSVLTINYVNGYQNTPITPPQRIDAWTTADLFVSYRTSDSAPTYMLRNLIVTLTVQNLTDEKPPYVNVSSLGLSGNNPIPYDPANASPAGRVVALQLTKRW